jgi:Zn ribbon nucleic-acid-binding protein
MNNKLKPCPFCSGKAKIHYDYSNFALVQCSKCGIGTLHKPNEVDVVKDWNTRKPMDKVVKHLEETREKDIPKINNTTTTRDEKVYKLAMSYAIDIVKEGGINERNI